MMTTELTPRAWVGCLACYNDGRLVGEWMDADTLEDADALEAICTRPDHEELWCFDTEDLGVGECSPMEAAKRARAVIELMRQADDVGIPYAVALQYVDDSNVTDPDCWPNVTETFYGSADNAADYVLDYLENNGITLPDWLQVNYEASFEELTSGMPKYRHEGTTYVFYE